LPPISFTVNLGPLGIVAFKSQSPLSFPLTADAIKSIKLVFGRDAVKILHSHPDRGYRFLPRVLARNESASEFGRPNLLNSTCFFELFSARLYKQYRTVDAFGVVFPSFWTYPQVHTALYGLGRTGGSVLYPIDEQEAACAYYATERAARIRRSPVHTLFVDVGATSVRAYGEAFKWDPRGQISIANTAYAWSERAGTHFIARAIAAARGVALAKAERLLRKGGAPALFEPELREIEGVMRAAIAQARANSDLPIDEVQVIGGGALVRAVVERLRAAAGGTAVKREFSAHEVLAIGGVYVGLAHMEIDAGAPRAWNRRAPYDINFTAQTDQPLCRRGAFCSTDVRVPGGGRSAEIVLAADGLPEGIAGGRISQIVWDAPADERAQLQISFHGVTPIVSRVKRCVKNECYQIVFNQSFVDAFANETGRFMKPYLDGQNRPTGGVALLMDIRILLEEMKEKLKADAVIVPPVTAKMKEVFQWYRNMENRGALAMQSMADLVEIWEELDNIRRDLSLKHEPVADIL
jgi:hypothetical protein